MKEEIYREYTSAVKEDKILIIKNNKYRIKCDSKLYKEFIMLDLPQGAEIKEYIYKAVKLARNENIFNVLFIEDNQLYSDMIKNMYDIAEKEEFNIYVIPEYNIGLLRKFFWIERLYIQMEYDKPRLTQFQVHLTDVCNVKCKGCGHYCNIIEEANMLEPGKYKNDLINMKKKFCGVEKIYLLGGEPLLNKNVSKIIEITRNIFPDANIRVTTNGVLLPKMDDIFWQILNKEHVHIEISLYKPTKEMWGDIQNLLIEKGAAYDVYVLNGREQFFKLKILEENKDYKKAYANCISNKCHYLRDGKIYLCPAVFNNTFFYEYFNIDMPYEPIGFDLNDNSISGWTILEKLQSPNEACKYCSEKPEYYEWETSSRDVAKLEDWVVD